MKKIIYLLLASCLMTSCSSDQPGFMPDIEPSAKTQVVSINIKGIEEFSETRSGGFRALSLTDAGVKHLDYFVYQNNSLVKRKHFIGEEAIAYGKINDTLPEGNYRIALVASTNIYEEGPIYSFNQISDSQNISLYGGIDFNGNNATLDAFHNTLDLEVKTSVTNPTQNITLKRIMSKIEVDVLDADKAPVDLKSIRIKTKSASQNFNLLTSVSGWASTNGTSNNDYTFALLYRDQLLSTNSNNPIWFNSFPISSISSNTDIIVELLSGDNPNNYTSKEITIKKDYSLKANQTLRLTGRLFTKDIESGEITINNEWDSEVVEENFD